MISTSTRILTKFTIYVFVWLLQYVRCGSHIIIWIVVYLERAEMKQQATFLDSFSNILLNFVGMSVTVLGYKIFFFSMLVWNILNYIWLFWIGNFYNIEYSFIDHELARIVNLGIPIIIYLGIYYSLLIGFIQSVINGWGWFLLWHCVIRNF